MSEFFSGNCVYSNDKSCPDILKIMESREIGEFNDDLEDQYYNLCTSGGKCLTRDKLLEDKLKA